MSRLRAMCIPLLAITILASCTTSRIPSPFYVDQAAVENGLVLYSEKTALPAVQVVLSAPDTTLSWDSRLLEPELFDLPLVYLHRQGQPAETYERTLTVQVAGLATGTLVELEALSWHVNRTTGAQQWEAARFVLPERPCALQDPCTVEWTLDAATMLSDMYRLVVRDTNGGVLWQNPDPEQPDFVALDTWEVPLGDYAVRVLYATLFPFARGEKQLYHRLSPEAVDDFVAGQLAPAIADIWQTQFDAWGYGPIQTGWDADHVVELILTAPPFALWGGTGTYTASLYPDGTLYPERRIWMQSSSNALQGYHTLEDGYRRVLSHEFHHLVQWNVLLGAGCPVAQWRNVFIEAQARMAPAVQYPELELRREHLAAPSSAYSSSAQRYLTLRLNTTYAEMEADQDEPYDAALYWRFLYEQFGSMDVLRVALEEMACRPEGDVATSLREVMDAALARLDGPFATYEESLIAFARANYALRLEGGRCTTDDLSACEGRYYDPDGLYGAPAMEAELRYSGAPLAYAGSIPASFGIDYLEVELDSDLAGQPLQIAFHSEGARFSVQLWKLDASGRRALTSQPEALAGDCRTGCSGTLLPQDLKQAGRLALIVVRLEPEERSDPVGSYTLMLE